MLLVASSSTPPPAGSGVGDVLVVLLPVVVGALLAVVPALIAGWWAARKEHERWIREQRLEAYQRVLELLHRTSLMKDAAAKASTQPSADAAAELRRQADDVQERVVEVLPSMTLLGPASVHDALNAWTEAPPEDKAERQTAMHAAMRKALKIRD